jgi:hypothetical protein
VEEIQMTVESTDKIILTSSLRAYFFDGLSALNKKSLCPIPESIIYYSSDVLDKFALSREFFDYSDGKVREKILGIKLLEASQLSKDDQRRVYKEVADMSLMTCGYFFESVNKKMVDLQYYSQLGKMAYTQLNNINPSFLDIPSFYGMVATCFESLTTLMMLHVIKSRSEKDNQNLFSQILIGENVSEKEMLIHGITKQVSDKAS